MSDWDRFDEELTEAAAQLPPPEDAARAVTPWRAAMDRIVLGLCLDCFTLDFLYLQYILPAVGTVALYLGFRSLRTCSPWFRAGWVAAICKVILLYRNFILLAAPFSESSLSQRFQLLGSALTLFLFFALRQGLRQAAEAVGQVPGRDPALWACLWYLGLMALAVFCPKPSLPVFAILVYVFYRIVKSLLAAAAELEDWGYAVTAAPVRISGGRLWLLALSSLLALTLLVSILSNHRPLRGAAVEPAPEPAETAAIRAELADLGVPPELLERLAPEDIPRLSGAVDCQIHGSEDGLPNGNDQENLHASQVLALAHADGSVTLLHFFSADADGTGWLNRYVLQADAALSDVTFRLSYTQGGQTYAACLPVTGFQEEDGLTIFGDPYHRCLAETAAFSWPLGSRDRQGYVLATADQAANPRTTLDELLLGQSESWPVFPYPTEFTADWSYGRWFYFGDGSGLIWKTDEMAE